VIGLGLGLAVGYSLLLVWRFREELSEGLRRRASDEIVTDDRPLAREIRWPAVGCGITSHSC